MEPLLRRTQASGAQSTGEKLVAPCETDAQQRAVRQLLAPCRPDERSSNPLPKFAPVARIRSWPLASSLSSIAGADPVGLSRCPCGDEAIEDDGEIFRRRFSRPEAWRKLSRLLRLRRLPCLVRAPSRLAALHPLGFGPIGAAKARQGKTKAGPSRQIKPKPVPLVRHHGLVRRSSSSSSLLSSSSSFGPCPALCSPEAAHVLLLSETRHCNPHRHPAMTRAGRDHGCD